MKFEAEGIPVLLHSMGQAPLQGWGASGGIRVEVPEEYDQRAVALLKEVKQDLDAKTDT